MIPILLLKDDGLVKTVKFKNPTYVGDPINAARIFNDSEVDELIILDISEKTQTQGPAFEKLEQLASECFMPVCYGGGLRTLDQVTRLISLGVEKVAFNTALVENADLIRQASKIYGASSIVASIDVRKKLLGRMDVVTHAGTKGTGQDPVTLAKMAEDLGAGEILLTSVDAEGGREGYDLSLVRSVVDAVRIPVVAHGGAGKLADVREVIKTAGASAAAAGSLFVFHGKLRGVLINYPTQQELRELFAP